MVRARDRGGVLREPRSHRRRAHASGQRHLRRQRARPPRGDRGESVGGFMSSLVTDIEVQIAGAKTSVTRKSVGTIREIGDGVARVEGLADVMVNEMLDLGHGVTGLALNLDETEVGVIILGDYTRLEEGGEVRGTGKLLQVPVGKGLLGRVVNTLGEPLDNKGP